MTRPRARDLGLPFPGTPGPFNAITDVPGVEVGFCTLTDPSRAMRTGVTAILPRPGTTPQPVWAGHYALNGNGEMTGTHWINDAGYFLGPFVGAAVDLLLPEWLRVTQGYYLLVYATLVMVLMMFFPKGIVGIVERIREHFRAKTGTFTASGTPTATATKP